MRLQQFLNQILIERGNMDWWELADEMDINRARMHDLIEGGTALQPDIRKIAAYFECEPEFIITIALEEQDVPEDKRYLFRQLLKPMKDLISSMIRKKID